MNIEPLLFNFFISSLRVSSSLHGMCHYPSTLPRPTLLSLSDPTLCQSKPTFQDHFALPELFLECLSQQLTTARHCSSRGGIVCPVSLPIWDLIWPGPSQVLRVLITTAVSSSVGLPRCAQTLLLGFYILPALSSAVISGSCRDGAAHLGVSYSLHPG